MIVYLDSSVALRRFLRQPGAWPKWAEWTRAYSSALLGVEMLRVVDRLRLEGSLDDRLRAKLDQQIHSLCDTAYLVPVEKVILERAGQPFPTVIGTLDAIHLATALALRDQEEIHLTFLTHDIQLGLAARSMNFPIEGI